MPVPRTELTVDFGPIAPDAPEDTPVPFSVRNERTGESWSEGEFRCPLDEQAVGDMRWYLEEYWQWPFGPFRDRAHGIEARLEGWGRELYSTPCSTRGRRPASTSTLSTRRPACAR